MMKSRIVQQTLASAPLGANCKALNKLLPLMSYPPSLDVWAGLGRQNCT
jgi:hypothetical protein